MSGRRATRRAERPSRPHASPRAERRPRLSAGRVLAGAWHAGVSGAGRILVVAVIVSAVAAVVETVLHELIDRASLPASVAADVCVSGVNMLGLVILSGVLSQVVGEAGHGRRPLPMGRLLASLPWNRLIRADLLVTALVTVGLMAFILPGLVLFTFLAVVGPVIEIEHRPVWQAVRRSARLARPHFWAVALLATLPVLLTDVIPATLPDRAGAQEIVVFLAIRVVGEGLAEAVVGVVVAELTYQLIAMARDAPASPARRTRPGLWPPRRRAARG